MLGIKGAFRVNKIKALGGNTQYLVLFLNDRLLFVKIGGELATAGWSVVDSRQQLERFESLSVDEVVQLHKNNFQVYNGEIVGIELRKSTMGLNGPRIGTFIVQSEKKETYDIALGQNFGVVKSIVNSLLPGKLSGSAAINTPTVKPFNGGMMKTASQPLSSDENPIMTADSVENKNERMIKNGANWFYWIAALSLINAVIFLAGANYSFIVGLGITQVASGFAKAIGGQAMIIIIILVLVVAAAFAALGYFAGKMKIWAFIVGMTVYSLDAVIFIFVRDWFSIAFHVFALFFIARGAILCFKLNKNHQPIVTPY